MRWIFLFLLFVLSYEIGFYLGTNRAKAEFQNDILNGYSYGDETFSKEELAKALKDLNVKFPHIVMAQSMLETGHWNSKIFIENNNLFGMKKPRLRVTTAIGEKGGYAQYLNWKESVYDYAIYQSAFLKGMKTEDEYFAYLSKNYAESPKYVSKLKSIIRSNNLNEYFS